MIVLDASQMTAWLIGEPSVARATEFDIGLRDVPIAVPAHWPIELSNMLRTHLRAGRLLVADMHAIMDRLDLLTIEIEAPLSLDEIGPLAQFASTHELTTYDAAYVQLALRRQAILATLDGAMRRAAARLNIPLLPA